jgi:hypothetical protein
MTFAYRTSDNVFVYLIQQTMDGSPERRLVARFILDCLRTYQTREKLAACFHDLEDLAILDLANEARELAVKLRFDQVAVASAFLSSHNPARLHRRRRSHDAETCRAG